jgi:hypothetical protein
MAPHYLLLASSLTQMAGGIGGFVQAGKEAKLYEEIARAEANLRRREGRERAGEQVAAYGKAGVRTDVGTPLRKVAQTIADAELEALRERFRGDVAAYQTRIRGQSLLTQSMLGAALYGYGAYKEWPSTKTPEMTSIYGPSGSTVRSFPFNPTRIA